jgi:preprotein translocase subunit SecG
MAISFYLMAVPFFLLCVLMVLIILIQKGRGGGINSAFGGGGGGSAAFGAKTGDVLTWVTAGMFGVFLLLSVGLNWTSYRMSLDAKAAQTGAVARNEAPAAPVNPTTQSATDSPTTPPTTTEVEPATRPVN